MSTYGCLYLFKYISRDELKGYDWDIRNAFLSYMVKAKSVYSFRIKVDNLLCDNKYLMGRVEIVVSTTATFVI